MERRPPDDSNDMGLEAQQRTVRDAGHTVLRLVTGGADLVPLMVDRPELPDLTVDLETALLIHRRRWRAVARGYRGPSDPVTHTAIESRVHEHLDGRRPAIGFGPDFVEVNFGVLDGGPESVAQARAVGDFLAAVVSPIGHREPQVFIKHVNTAHVDRFLTEDLRTLR